MQRRDPVRSALGGSALGQRLQNGLVAQARGSLLRLEDPEQGIVRRLALSVVRPEEGLVGGEVERGGATRAETADDFGSGGKLGRRHTRRALVIPAVITRCRLCVGNHAVKPLDRGDHGSRAASDHAEQGRQSFDHKRVGVAPVPVVKTTPR